MIELKQNEIFIVSGGCRCKVTRRCILKYTLISAAVIIGVPVVMTLAVGAAIGMSYLYLTFGRRSDEDKDDKDDDE